MCVEEDAELVISDNEVRIRLSVVLKGNPDCVLTVRLIFPLLSLQECVYCFL